MKFLQVISDSSQIDRSLEYDVLYYNTTTDRIDVVEYNPITSTTYEVKNVSNPTSLPYDTTSMVVSFTGVKTETYKSGKVEVTETSETETVSFEANTSSAETATRSGSFEWNEQSVAWSTTLGVAPAIKITMQDAYTDTSVIALTATKSASVEGTIVWSTDLASATAKIDNGSIVFLKHYEGSVVLTATASNASAEKTITVTCDEEVTATTYELGTQSALADVPASTTSATVNYTVIPTYHYKLKDDFVGEPISTSKVVTFAANTSTTEEDTKSGSFTDSYGVTVNWSVKQLVVPAITITVGDALDTDIIALTATKNKTVQGEITWTCNLASDVAEINGATLVFKQHYEGSVVLTATASNASAEKTITVSCEEVATATTYSIKANSISVAETQPMEASSTSATVNFVGVTTQYYKLKDSVSVESNETQTVEFEANGTTETVTRNGSFDWNGESVAWEVELKAWTLDPTMYIEDTDGTYHEYLYDPTQRTIESEPAIIDLNGDEWAKFDEDDSYDYYKSMNQGIDSSFYQFCVTWSGVENAQFLYRSYAQSIYDYLVVGKLDGDKFTSQPDYTSGQAHTRGNQTTTYNTLNINCTTHEHHIWFCYRKNASTASNDDTAYVGIPKSLIYQTITDGKTKMGDELPFEWVNDGAIQEDVAWYHKQVKEYTLGDGSKVKSSVYRKGEEIVFEMVDLGLPSGLKWANMNVGATAPWEGGYFFQWGETEGHDLNATDGTTEKQYNWSTTPFNNGSSDYDETYFASVKDTVCPNRILAAEYDAATTAYGEGYRMPTYIEISELIANTTSTWYESGNTEFNGVAGTKFTSKSDVSKSIFIPAAGQCANGSCVGVGYMGNIWTSYLDSYSFLNAYSLTIYSFRPEIAYSWRCYGFSVRAVHE